MRVKSLDSLLNGDTKLKTVRVRKCDQDYAFLQGHPFFNEFKAVYGYYLYKIQSKQDYQNTFAQYVMALKGIHEKISNCGLLKWKTANFFLYFIDVINEYYKHNTENHIEPHYRMSCASFFYSYSLKTKIYNPENINNVLFNNPKLYEDYSLAKKTHFFRFMEFYYEYIAEQLPVGETLSHSPMPNEIGFNIAHGIESMNLSAEKLYEERRTYYGES